MGAGIFDVSKSHILKGFFFTGSKRRESNFVWGAENNSSGHVDKPGAAGNNGGPMLSKLGDFLITNSLFV